MKVSILYAYTEQNAMKKMWRRFGMRLGKTRDYRFYHDSSELTNNPATVRLRGYDRPLTSVPAKGAAPSVSIIWRHSMMRALQERKRLAQSRDSRPVRHRFLKSVALRN